MTDKQNTQIEKIKVQEQRLKERRKKLEAKARDQEKKQQQRILYLWGEVAAAALKEGELSAEQWRSLCKRHIAHEKTRALALEAITDHLPGTSQ